MRYFLFISSMLIMSGIAYANTQTTPANPSGNPSAKNTTSTSTSTSTDIDNNSDSVLPNPFHISLYQPNYLMPGYYETAPPRSLYTNTTPSNEALDNVETKFQFSFKVPILSDIHDWPLTWYAAYTQLSYWQSYNQSAFFRESNYEPETFLEYAWDKKMFWNWCWALADVGMMHQSNGRGGDDERSWNRIYLASTFTHDAWHVYVQPWYVLHDESYDRYNPDMARYLGYGQWIVSYHWGRQTFAFMSRNNVTSGFVRGAEQLTWSFPLVQELRGYVQVFHGYGESLIEYNQKTTAVGIGIALNDY